MKFLIAIVVISICLTAIQASLQPTLCGGKRQAAVIKSFELDGCSAFPCTLTRGTNATLKLTIEPTQRINGLKLAIHGVLGGKEVPFSTDDNDHCKLAIKDAKCPLQRRKVYKYANSIQVLKQYPSISVSVRYAINDLNGKPVLCIQFPSKIV